MKARTAVRLPTSFIGSHAAQLTAKRSLPSPIVIGHGWYIGGNPFRHAFAMT